MPTDRGNTFWSAIRRNWNRGKNVCVGIDAEDINAIPLSFLSAAHNTTNNVSDVGSTDYADVGDVNHYKAGFARFVMSRTHDLVCCYKINRAFWSSPSPVRAIHEDTPVILDAKIGDVDFVNSGYAREVFDAQGFGAVTVHPYMGKDAMAPFLERTDKGVFVLCSTTNPGSGEFQDLVVQDPDTMGYFPLYQLVAKKVNERWNENRTCGLVVGATNIERMQAIREIAPDVPFLVPGIGAQGGDVASVATCGVTPMKDGLIINSSRSILFNGFNMETIELDEYIQEVRDRIAELQRSISVAMYGVVYI